MLIAPAVKILKHYPPSEKLIITIVTNDLIPEGSFLLLARLSPNDLIDWRLVSDEMLKFQKTIDHPLLDNDTSGTTANELSGFLDRFYDKSMPLIYNIFTKKDFPSISDTHWASFCNLINDDFPIENISHLLNKGIR